MPDPRDPAARPTLPPAVTGERFEFDSAAGRLSAYVAGQGPPLLLVHSVNAAASVAEVAPLFEHCRAKHTVFALDLPGFGFSERSDRDYNPRLMTDALLAMREPMQRRCGERPADALAVSLSGEFLARAAAEAPGTWRSLALVSPTGFNGGRARTEPPGSTQAMPWLLAALRGPGWGGALFRALTRPGVVRYFLERTFGSKQIDEALWRYAVITARQRGAEYAPLHFLAGSLFSTDIHTVYRQLVQPVWMSHGVRGDFVDYRGKKVVADRPNWRFDVFATGAMPYFELPRDFNSVYDGFLARA
jgi:pimeloyl-ACP methyl ester carboxylesterase